MNRSSRSHFLRLLWLLAALLLLLPELMAKEPSVRGSLSSRTASVGEAVDYELSIEGLFDPDEAPVPQVDGLELRGTSHGSQMMIAGGSFTRTTTVTYRLVPRREGTFTIPPMEVTVEGKKLRTAAVTLKVTGGRQAAEAGDLAFAEIRLNKKSAYVGEAVPVEVRLYLESGPRWHLQQQPVLSGSGFTLQPFGKFSERPVEMAGKNYAAVTFRSIITPGKAGKITIGPLPMKASYSEQRIIPQFGMLNRPGRAQELEVTAPAVTLEAKLLPAAGRPADFAGAVGKYGLEGIGTPNRVNVGEPVQMVLKVRGEGNFEGITAPTIVDPDGWRVYDPEQKFEPEDGTENLSFKGTMTFSLPVAPTTRKTQMPVFSFSFFNPEKEKYETVKTTAAPLTVTGAAPPAAAPSAAAPATSDARNATPPPAAGPQDILGILPDRDSALNPGLAFSTPILLGIALAPVPLIAAALYFRRRGTDQQSRRRQYLRRDREMRLKVARDSSDPAAFYDAAAGVLQVDAALEIGKEPHACELGDILAARKLSPETQAAVKELFDARAALIYAGGGRENETIRSSDRDRVLETLADYEGSAPR
jgi:hypothetical protein